MLADKSAEEDTDSELSSIVRGRSLLDLPVELLEEVKGHLHSLQSHVYFAQTCTKINSLYDEEMWRRILFAAGYAIPLAYMEESEVMWDDWAFAVVQDAELFRDHQEITGWVTAELVTKGHLNGTIKTKAKSLKQIKKGNIAVSGGVDHPVYCGRGQEVDAVFLIADDGWDVMSDEDGKDMRVFDHPCVAGRFLTLPPTTEARVDDGKTQAGEEDYVKNSFGLTFMDALGPVAESLASIPPEWWGRTDHTFFEGLNGSHGYYSIGWGS